MTSNIQMRDVITWSLSARLDAAEAEVKHLTKMLDVCAVTHDHNVKLKNEVDRLREDLNTAHVDCQRLRRKIRKYTIELKSHTWQQERAAVVAWLRGAGWMANPKDIEAGDHWPEGGTP